MSLSWLGALLGMSYELRDIPCRLACLHDAGQPTVHSSAFCHIPLPSEGSGVNNYAATKKLVIDRHSLSCFLFSMSLVVFSYNKLQS
jgi:hypothetical protein